MLNERGHIEKMLKRARRRQRQAAVLAEKWSSRLDALGPEPAGADQPLLWVEQEPDAVLSGEEIVTLPLPFAVAVPDLRPVSSVPDTTPL